MRAGVSVAVFDFLLDISPITFENTPGFAAASFLLCCLAWSKVSAA